MTPAARIAAAIEILDAVLGGESTEKSLLGWARKSRFAGSGDRNAVRDLVFDGVRRKRSLGWLGGAETGRGLMIGRLRGAGHDPGDVFTGEGYAPPPLTDREMEAGQRLAAAPEAVRCDCPDWLWPIFRKDHGEAAAPILETLSQRAPVFLRVNRAKTEPAVAIRRLAEDGIAARLGPLSPTALIVEGHPRRIEGSSAFGDGLVELQDAASQAVVDLILPFAAGRHVLDYCAGGGGKALNLAAGGAARVVAHDAEPTRMKDIPVRAERAGCEIEVAEAPEGLFDCVVTDVPCSGSGAWRRQPEAKWRLSEAGLARLHEVQGSILENAAAHVGEGGVLAYVTCSLLRSENDAQVDAFLARDGRFAERARRQFTPLDGGDGFFVAILQRR